MKLKFLLLSFLLFCSGSGLMFATDFPSFRVDINKFGRSVAEGNNPNFLPWTFCSANIVRDTLIHSSFPTDTVIA
jgi:hypothetical protein